MQQISIVIPVLDEEDSINDLHREIIEVAAREDYDLEIVFVDDGSNDDSWHIIDQLVKTDNRVRAIRFRKNFGKAAALRAGVAETRSDLIITMDADGQDDPSEIPTLIDKMGDDFDLVTGWKKDRKDPIGKTFPSKVFNWLVGWMTGVKLHDHNCGFKLYRREIFDEIKLYGEMHRFVPVLAAARGFRVGEVPVNHRPRVHGRSKYGLARLPKGFLDLMTVSFLTGFNQRPQHMLGSFGLLAFLVGSIGMFWMAVYWILRMTSFPDWDPLHQRPVVIYSLGAMLLGAQLLCIGFLAELIIARGQANENPYSIMDRIGVDQSSSTTKDE